MNSFIKRTLTSLISFCVGCSMFVGSAEAQKLVSDSEPAGSDVSSKDLKIDRDFGKRINHRSQERPMMLGQDGWNVTPLFTIGSSFRGYRPPGLLDGIGAIKLNERTVRILVNHELGAADGYEYSLSNGTKLTGARVGYFDLDVRSRRISKAGLAYKKIVDRAGVEVADASQINEGVGGIEGFDRFCSSYLIHAGVNGFVDNIYFTGEETSNGQEFALDVDKGVMYAVPQLGRASFENVTSVNTGTADKIAIVVGDDRQAAPLSLYVGQKDAVGDNSFLDRNGLAQGDLYVWVADNGDLDPEDFNGTWSERSGKFVKIENFNASKAGASGYDDLGYAHQSTLDSLVASVGGFHFSRPEDLDWNPENPAQIVLVSTGRGSVFPSDNWGTTYLIDFDFSGSEITGDIEIIYDSDDGGGGQFSHPDFGLRSPDNLDWTNDGKIYIQEDRSTSPSSLFGGKSGAEASIWELNPTNGKLTRIAMIDRSAVPADQDDPSPDDIGNWESSGVLDVTGFFKTKPGEILLIADVQAHSLQGRPLGGSNQSNDLVQGGQLILLAKKQRAHHTNEAAMMIGTGHGWQAKPVFTVGESINGYRPPGVLDGIGAVKLDEKTVRLFVNHELNAEEGYEYVLTNGTTLTGSRVSYIDVDARSKKIIDADLGFDSVVDRAGQVVTDPAQINEGDFVGTADGIGRLCSSYLVHKGTNGFVDDIYFTGEEVSNGQEFALDVAEGVIYAVPMLGRASFENVTSVNTGSSDKIAILVGDDRQAAPLCLYIGQKDHKGDHSFLDRNGLAYGELYVWVSDDDDANPEDFNGTGRSRDGHFVEIEHYDASKAGAAGYDALGFANQTTLDQLATDAGAFRFSRPEDLDWNPKDPTQVVLVSTGRGSFFPADNWGTTYLLDLEFNGDDVSCYIEIIYDGDDAGRGQFPDPDYGLRSPDNLDWAHNGNVYIQEDRSTSPGSLFGGASREEASLWELAPWTGNLRRVAQIDRSAVPFGQTDPNPSDIGNWESSGVLDVSRLFHTPSNEILLVIDVQAHSLTGRSLGGSSQSQDLVQGGQLLFLSHKAGRMSDYQRILAAKQAASNAADFGVPTTFEVKPNFPNPFNPTTTIRYALPEKSYVEIIIFNTLGQKVKTLFAGQKIAGYHNVKWDATNDKGAAVTSGLYIYSVRADGQSFSGKMMLLK